MYRKLSIFLIALIVLISTLCGVVIKDIGFDYNFENFFPSDDKELDFFLQFREKFENDNDYLLFAFENSEGIFRQDFLRKVDAFADSLERLNHVEEVLSPSSLEYTVIGPMGGSISIPYIDADDPEGYAKDSLRIYESEHLVGTFFSPRGKSVCMLMKNTQIITKKESDELLGNIERLINKFEFDELHYAGKVRAQDVYLSKMKWELLIFMSSSVVLIILLLIVAFRSVWGVFVPLFIVLLAIVWTLSIIHLSGYSLNLMTSLLPTILFVVGMSDAVHIISRYLEELRKGLSKLEALKVTFKEIGTATFLTSFTTAVGFLTLLLVSIKPIREFGLFTSVGVFIAFVLAILLLPSVLYLMKTPAIRSDHSARNFWLLRLRTLFSFMLRHQKKVIWAYVFILILSAVGISRIEVNYYLLEDLDKEHPLQKDLRYFEDHYAGVRPFEMVARVKDSSRNVFSPEVIREINKVETYLRQEYEVGFVYSPLSFLKGINQALHSGKPEYYKIPESDSEMKRVLRYADRMKHGKSLAQVTADEGKTVRISAKMPDVGSQRAKELNNELEQFISTKTDTSLLSYHRTGTALLIDKNNEKLIRNMLAGLGVAFFVIALLVGILFRSAKMAVISLVPNFIPLLIIGGVMGFMGIDLNMSTSIVFTIAFGIAVDDTIHFLSKLRLELGKGRTYLYALKRTYFSTGRAITITSIILCGGFVTLMLSDFQSTFMIGFFVSLILFVAVLTDLLLLPVLLMVYKRSLKGQD